MTYLYAKLQTQLHTHLEVMREHRHSHPDAGAIDWAIVTAATITIAIAITAAVTVVAKKYTDLIP